MKFILVMLTLFVTGISPSQANNYSTINLTTFTKVPDDLTGCGDAYYLSEKDKKNGKMICCDNIGDLALLNINHAPIKFKVSKALSNDHQTVYINGDYTLIIKNGPSKQLDSEYYIMKSTIIIKYKKQIVWSRSLIGDGGC